MSCVATFELSIILINHGGGSGFSFLSLKKFFFQFYLNPD